MAPKVRTKADKNITVEDLKRPLLDFMKEMGSRDVYHLINQHMKSVSYTSAVKPSALVALAPLLKSYVGCCKNGVIPGGKHTVALQHLNAQAEPGMGVLKINFTDLEDVKFYDLVDTKIKTLMKQLRELKMKPESANRAKGSIPSSDWASIEEVLQMMEVQAPET